MARFHLLGWVLTAAGIAAVVIAGVPRAGAQQPPALPMQRPASPNATTPGDPFGEELTLTAKTIIYLRGTAKWDSAFDTLVDSYRSLNEYLAKEGVTASGPALTIYTGTDDVGFQYQAAVPVAEPPTNPPKGDLALGQSPAGKALKFVHRGTYEAMDLTYEAIANYLDEKRLEARDLFVEEYVTDLLKTPPDKLVVYVYVPIKER
jgi:effector-binding domain-containing protein